jgi:hypothetical protein
MPADTSSYRTALGLFIHDAEIAMMLYHEPILRRKVKAILLGSVFSLVRQFLGSGIRVRQLHLHRVPTLVAALRQCT